MQAHPTPEPLRAGVFEALRDLAREGPVEVDVRGSCMAPRIADGQRVRVVAARVYWPGDILAFQSGDGRLRVHRLLGWAPGGLVTRGDHCPCHDGAVPAARVLGRVEQRVGLAERARAVLDVLRLVLHR
ncbi:MAG: S24/S26 family peptidase [Acidobacteriota bacterium]